MLTVFPRDNCNDLFSAWLCESSSFRFGYGLYLVFVFYLSNKRTLKSNKSIDDSKLHQQTKNTKNHPKCTLQLQEIITLSLTKAHIRMDVGFLCAKKRLMLWFWSLFGLYSC